MTTMHVVGTEQVLAMLTAAGAAGGVALEAGTDTAARIVVVEAQARVPVVTGALRDSIQATADGVEATAPYAAFVEYGTSDTPAQPFLRPAADGVPDEAIVAVMAAVMRGI